MGFKKIKILLLIIFSLLVVFILYESLLLVTYFKEFDKQKELLLKWYKYDYIPSEFEGKVVQKRFTNEKNINIIIVKFYSKEKINITFGEKDNEGLNQALSLNDTIKKVKDLNKIYLIENGTRKDSFKLKFPNKLE